MTQYFDPRLMPTSVFETGVTRSAFYHALEDPLSRIENLYIRAMIAWNREEISKLRIFLDGANAMLKDEVVRAYIANWPKDEKRYHQLARWIQEASDRDRLKSLEEKLIDRVAIPLPPPQQYAMAGV